MMFINICMATTLGDSQDDPKNIAQKKALTMTLGNAKDLNALLDLLYSEDNEELVCLIVTVIAALGRIEAIVNLEKIYESDTRANVRERIEEAIEVIRGISGY